MMTSIRNRWWIFGAASLVVVVAVVVALVVSTRRQPAQPQSPPSLGLPPQLLLTASMRREPVPGWKTSSEELGFPPGTIPKVIGNIGDNAYFLGITGTGWWLVGLDVSTGRRTFAPLELGRSDDALSFDCFVNGPTMILCLRQDRDPAKLARAWVVDSSKGQLLFDGATQLRLSSDQGEPMVEQRGDFALATVNGEGVHGIGRHAELTWFVPGRGSVSQERNWNHDSPPQPIAVQGGAGSSPTDVVFRSQTAKS